jgi:secreted trypsin-like serine protease
MTAAHCITDEVIDPLITTVVVGRHSQSNDPGERIQAARVLVHEEYADNGTPDVALVELQRAPEAAITPIQIAGPGEESLYATGRMATILGWGNTSDGGGSSDVLKEAQVPIVSDEECGRAYADPSWGWTPADMICAGYPEGGTDTCQGDSGGPMVVPAPGGTWRQVGITSFGEGCAKAGWPGVYSEAAGQKIREWVRSFVPGAIAAPSAPEPSPAVQPTPAAEPAPAPAPAQPAPQPAAKRKAAVSKPLKRCLKKAGKSKRKQRACRRKHRR